MVVAPAAKAQTSPVEQVRKAYFDQTGEAPVLAKKLLAEHPDDAALVRWNKKLQDIEKENAQSVAGEPEAQPDPNKGWALLERAKKASPWEKGILCDEALAATPNDVDLLIECTTEMTDTLRAATDDEQDKVFRANLAAFLKQHAAAYPQSGYALAKLAEAEEALSTRKDELAKEAARTAMQSADRSLALDPLTADAILTKVHLLNNQGDRKSSYALLQKSIADGSLSVPVFQAYLSAILGNDAMSVDERNKVLLGAVKARLEKSEPSSPLVNAMVSDTQSAGVETTGAIEEMILKRYPNSDAADTVHMLQATLSDPAIATDPFAPEKATALEEYLDSTGHHVPANIKRSRSLLIYILSGQKAPDFARLYKELLLPHDDPYSDAPAFVKLADHHEHLPELEQLAQKIYDEQVQQFAERSDRQTDKQGFAYFAQGYFYAPWVKALGVIALEEGKLDQAQEKLLSAAAMSPNNLGITMELGKLYETKKDYKLAEKTYDAAIAMSFYGEGEHPAVAALKKNYELQHPGKSGLDAYMKDILQHDLDRREAAVLGDRLASPLSLPVIKLTTLDGKTVSSTDFAGKVVVINFWATWCGPCREELPDFEKLYARYKDDPKVLILSMATDSADTPVATIANFIHAHKYSFPVLLGPQYGTDNSITPIPMSWFIAPDGKIIYRKIGYTREVVQEFGWRVEALRNGNVAKTGAGQ
jgi:thiol-disulfide isomerase/thioredoxin/tetratricopeptide (TPR) repeat protein